MVNFKKILGLLFLVLAFGSFLAAVKLLILDRGSPPTASLRVDSFPQTIVYLNDKKVGEAPFLGENLSPGEYKLKLIPSGAVTGTFISWEAKIKLTTGTLTYVSRNLGPTQETSGGQILMLEKLPLSDSQELAVVSDPDGALVAVDGQNEGQSSLVLHNLTAGNHDIVVSLPGFADQITHGKLVAGYRLNIIDKLAKLPEDNKAASSSAHPAADLVSTQSGEVAKPYVLIKDTPTGFLRVHTDPGLNATESAKIKPGEKYPLLSETSGWVKIKLPAVFGWVSDQYVTIVR